MFAALLLSCGSLLDRIGAKRLLLAGRALFVVARLACCVAPTIPVLIASLFVQGSAAAAMMPAGMALLNHADLDLRRCAPPVAVCPWEARCLYLRPRLRRPARQQ